jgi:hypothetical protein
MGLSSVVIHPTLSQIDARSRQAFSKDTKVAEEEFPLIEGPKTAPSGTYVKV